MTELIVCMVASLGAGLGTGLAGLSAASVISPMLITFLGVPPYQAIGIALASDVLASAVSAYEYGRNKHLDVRNGMILLLCVLVFTFIGSFLSVGTSENGLGFVTVAVTMFIGLRLLIFPKTARSGRALPVPDKEKTIRSVLFGSLIGCICGFVGAGGGMMMLLVLTAFLGYELKTAVGTSVFVMAFTAFTGSMTHIAVGGVYDFGMLGLCILFTCFFAQVASSFANKVSEKVMSRTTGAVLTALGVGMMIFRYL